MARAPYLNARLQPYTSTIFAEMSALATAKGAINLGQGFPDTDGPEEIKQAAIAAIEAGYNQYPPGMGIPSLREAISAHQLRCYGQIFDPDDEVLVTAGATEAIAAALLSLCEPGDEVVLFEPFYDSYGACVAMSGATRRVVSLRAPTWTFSPEDLRAAITTRTRVVMLNSPHNPTGKVFANDELAEIARVCVEHDLIAITDEVYEHLVFDGLHQPLATFPGMADRTIQISSGAKTFSFTGWKVGWACASAPLITAVRTAKQFLTYVNAAPLQHAIAAGLEAGARLTDAVAPALRPQRDLLHAGLDRLGFSVLPSAATFFLTTDLTPLGEVDGARFCWALPERCGVAAIPSAVFYDDPSQISPLVRWTFCKKPAVLEEALERLEKLLG